MPAYVIAHFTIHDQESYGRYAEAFPPILARFNGKLVAVDDKAPILEGIAPVGRSVVLEFPDKETAYAWSNDPEYQQITKLRRAGTEPFLVTIIGDRPEGWTGS